MRNLFFALTLVFTSYANAQMKANIDEIKKAADWQINIYRNDSDFRKKSFQLHKRDWEWGTFMAGLTEVYKVSKDKKYLAFIEEFGNAQEWNVYPMPYNANIFAITQTYLEYYGITKKSNVIKRAQDAMDMNLCKSFPDKVEFDGNVYWYESWTWCDALFMAPSAFARMSAVTGDAGYLEYAIKRWWCLSDYLYDTTEHLFFRDDRFINKRSENGTKIFWSRGNGWVIAGLCRMLEYMPENHLSRDRFIKQYREMAQKILSLVQPNDLWTASLLDPKGYPEKETSGSSFYVYALAWGINHGILDKEKYLPQVSKSWKALLSCQDASGKLGYVQPVGDDPRKVNKEMTQDFGVGAFLLAGSEILKLNNIK